MTKPEFEQIIKNLSEEFNLKKKQAIEDFCIANNPYKIGDVFTDQIGSIIIEKIQYAYSLTETPCCVYFGTELKKDGTPKKNNTKRNAWQSNSVH